MEFFAVSGSQDVFNVQSVLLSLCHIEQCLMLKLLTSFESYFPGGEKNDRTVCNKAAS